MKRVCWTLFFFMIVLSIAPHVSATSWISIEPEKVLERADVIVQGTYDFSAEPELSHFIFQGLTFYVDKVYKGEVSKKLIAGIDGYDVGWAQKFQDQGGEFILFLEETEGFDFLVPVSGPNGMVRIKDGQIMEEDLRRKVFFEDFLKAEEERESSVKSLQQINGNPAVLYLASAGMVVIIALFFIIYWRWRRRTNGA